ncbi:MAG: hypothetical protein IPM28_12110 [Chloracidobacterium sp.]|nr:hypothetical protein [Chloracidobacterium sp.]
MKRCPKCGTTYTDETLRYCLADGTGLTALQTEEPTLVSSHREGVRVDITESVPATSPSIGVTDSNKSGVIFKILIAVALLGVLGIAILGVAGAIFFYTSGLSGADQTNVRQTSPTPVSTTPDREKEKLQKELADLQKKLEEQNNSTSNSDTFSEDELGSPVTATVNSPKDGFLALRNLPTHEFGERIAKIPHGDQVEILGCDDEYVVIAERRGRWCLATWKTQAGWVFDAWLTY